MHAPGTPPKTRATHTTQHNTTQHNTTQHNTTQHNTTQHNTTQHNTTQHNTTQHNATQHNTHNNNTTQEILVARGWEGEYPLFTTVNRIVAGYFPPTDVVKFNEVRGCACSWCVHLRGARVCAQSAVYCASARRAMPCAVCADSQQQRRRAVNAQVPSRPIPKDDVADSSDEELAGGKAQPPAGQRPLSTSPAAA
jgi:hypothetical protein